MVLKRTCTVFSHFDRVIRIIVVVVLWRHT